MENGQFGTWGRPPWTPQPFAGPPRTCQEHLQQLQVCRNETFSAWGGEVARNFSRIAHGIRMFTSSIALVEEILHLVCTYALILKIPKSQLAKMMRPKFVRGFLIEFRGVVTVVPQKFGCFPILPSYCYLVIHYFVSETQRKGTGNTTGKRLIDGCVATSIPDFFEGVSHRISGSCHCCPTKIWMLPYFAIILLPGDPLFRFRNPTKRYRKHHR